MWTGIAPISGVFGLLYRTGESAGLKPGDGALFRQILGVMPAHHDHERDGLWGRDLKARNTLVVPALFVALMLAACDRPHLEEASKDKEQSTPPTIAQTIELKAAEGSNHLNGVATILNPDTLLQIDADLKAIGIAAGFSKGTAERYKSARALSRQTVENAERQAGTDATQKALLETRLKHTWGEHSPFMDTEQREELISDLSAGTQAIVRLDFPDIASAPPRNVHVAPLSGGDGVPVKTMWVAPTGNLSMPGVSYFGLIDAGPGLRPGDRAKLTADGSLSRSGVIIPSSAIVVFAGQSWCFIETTPKKFERRAVTLDLPVDDGFLVNSGFLAGQHVVVRGASLLLSREAGPGEDDDEDGASKKTAEPDADKKSEPTSEKTSVKGQDKDKPDDDKPTGSVTKPDTKAAASSGKDPD
jgi:hypothetical protein